MPLLGEAEGRIHRTLCLLAVGQIPRSLFLRLKLLLKPQRFYLLNTLICGFSLIIARSGDIGPPGQQLDGAGQ